MSLNWDVSRVANMEEVCFRRDEKGDRYLGYVTETLVWATMAVGMGEITEKNYNEFFSRLSFHESVHGAFMRKRDGNDFSERPITRAEVRAHIGLRTNVSKETQAKWLKRQFESYARDARRNAELEEQKEQPRAAGQPLL